MITLKQAAAIAESWECLTESKSYGGMWADQWVKTKSAQQYDIPIECGLAVRVSHTNFSCEYVSSLRIIQQESGQVVSIVKNIVCEECSTTQGEVVLSTRWLMKFTLEKGMELMVEVIPGMGAIA